MPPLQNRAFCFQGPFLQISQDEMESRVAAAMELLDVHQPKAVKAHIADGGTGFPVRAHLKGKTHGLSERRSKLRETNGI